MDSKGNIYDLNETSREQLEKSLGETLAALTPEESRVLGALPKSERAKLYDHLVARAFNAYSSNSERNAAKRERKAKKR